MGDQQVSVTTFDDETPQLTVTIADSSVSEADGPAATTATVARNTPPSGALVVSLSISDASEASAPATVAIPAGEFSITFDIDAVDDPIVDGTQTVMITATASGHVSGSDTVLVTSDDTPAVAVAILDSAVSEADGPDAASATVSRNTIPNSPLVVTLSSSNASEALVPSQVVIPAGQFSRTFDIDTVDDTFVDGTQTPVITASAFMHNDGSDSLDVTDDDVPTLTVRIPDDRVGEGRQVQGTVRRNVPPSGPLTVSLSNSNPADAIVPASVVITDGALEATFPVEGVDDPDVDGAASATLTATASGFADGVTSFSITDDDVPTLTLTIDPDSISENGGSATATVARNTAPTGSLLVVVTNDDSSEVSVPSSVILASSERETTFTVTALDDDIFDQTQTATLTIAALGFAGASNSVEVTDDEINLPPTLNALSDMSIAAGSGLQTIDLSGISAGGLEDQPLRISTTSTEMSLIPAPTVTYTSGNSTGQLQFTPPASDTGSTTITVTVEDAGLDLDFNTAFDNVSFDRQFDITVTPFNAAPTMNTPLPWHVSAGANMLTLTGLSAGVGEPNQPFSISVESGDSGLISVLGVTHSGQAPTAQLQINATPQVLANATTLTVHVTDAGPDNSFATTEDNRTTSTPFLVSIAGEITVDLASLAPTARDLDLTPNGLDLELHVDSTLFGSWYSPSLNSLSISGNNEDNHLTVDFQNGILIPGGGLHFAGGGQSSPRGDTLELINAAPRFVTHRFADAHSGEIDLNQQWGVLTSIPPIPLFRTTTLTYSGLEPIIDRLSATDRTFAFAATSDIVTLGDDGVDSNGMSRISSVASSEVVDFVDPTGLLTIDLGHGTDRLKVLDLDSGPMGVMMLGGAGNDVLNGGGGDDTQFGGSGRDQLSGHGGKDSLFGQGGTGDFLSGGDDDDLIDGGAGNDAVIESGDADFTLTNTSLRGLGRDTVRRVEEALLIGGPSRNRIDVSQLSKPIMSSTLFGGGGGDVLIGTESNDILFGGDGDDHLIGLDGRDIGLGQAGRDRIVGGPGNDLLFGHGGSGDVLQGGEGDDLLNGGAGTDRIFESGDVDFTINGFHMTGVGNDLVFDLETATLVGGPSANVFNLEGFNAAWTVLSGLGGADVFLGSPGRDVIFGGDDNDIAHGNGGNDLIRGDAGDDHLFGGDQNDELLGGDDNDILNGGFGDDCLNGGAGNDGLSGFAGEDNIDGAAGDDILYGGAHSDTASGGDGDDIIFGGGDADAIIGGAGTDILSGNEGSTANPGDIHVGLPGEIDDLFVLDPRPDWVDQI